MFANQLTLVILYESFDPLLEMIEIALRFDINSEDLTTLLHPSLCLASLLEAGAMVAVISIDNSHIKCGSARYSSPGRGSDALLVIVLFLEIFSPLGVHALDVFLSRGSHPSNEVKDSKSYLLQQLLALIRLDLLISASLLRAMQVVTWPVAILSYFSIRKREHKGKKARLLDMDVRSNDEFSRYALTRRESEGADTGEWRIVSVLRTLCSRYTVQYSFLKLGASIIISMALNGDYMFCGNAGGYLSEEQCPLDCDAHCIFESVQHHTDDSLYPTSHAHHCNPGLVEPGVSMVHKECFCDNWVMTDFLAIFFNTIHFTLQCFYLIHYNNFDPQQNQIDCVQSYTFVGENITLFLTHPAITLLSVLEAAVLIVSWTAVVMKLGIVCSADNGADRGSLSSAVLFALFMTVLEVYKANMTVASNAWKERKYGWAIFSLLRVDLFVFYGTTLFLQTFLFPSAILGYVISEWFEWKKKGELVSEESKEGQRCSDVLYSSVPVDGNDETHLRSSLLPTDTDTDGTA